MSKYHYKYVETHEPMPEDRLNAIADEGWRLVTVINTPQNYWPLQYVFEEEVKETRAKRDKETLDEEEAFVEHIYQMYPSKCPKRNKTLGKCDKNRTQIRSLMKKYTKEQIESVVTAELQQKLGKEYLKNFTTFLNQFPDPSTLTEQPASQLDMFAEQQKQQTNGWE